MKVARKYLGVAGVVAATGALVGLSYLVIGSPTAGATPAPLMSCDTDAECAALPACRQDPTCDGGPVNMPHPVRSRFVLVGQGCGSAKVIMVASEEDEFPVTCEHIDAHWLP